MKINLPTLKNVVLDLNERLINNRISNVTIISSKVLLFTFSIYRKEKLLVCLEHQNPFISLVEFDESIPTITGGLNDVLRKELKEAIVTNIKLLNDDRVLDISVIKTNDFFEREEKHLIFELVPFRTNLILTDKDYIINYAAHYSSLESNRPIIRGAKYEQISKNNSFNEDEEALQISEVKDYAVEYIYSAKRKRILERYQPLFTYIKGKIKSLKNKIKVLDKEYEEAKNKLIYQEYGNYILSYIDDPEEIKRYFIDNNVEVDLTIPSGQLANLFFKKYKKAKRTLQINRQEHEKANKEIQYLEVIQNQIDFMDDEDMYELAKEVMPFKFKNDSKKPNKRDKYSYVVVDRIKIYFGKNMQQNADISFKIADKSHYYFHIKDYHGSHVVVATDSPNKEVILTAAEMCLILSHKTAGDVQYTQIKNIKKGPELGLALLNKYELITLHSVRDSTIELLKNHN